MLPMTLTAAQIIDAASAAIVSRVPNTFVLHSRFVTPDPNVVESGFYSVGGEFRGTSMQTASSVTGRG
jgi:hypothetical protein